MRTRNLVLVGLAVAVGGVIIIGAATRDPAAEKRRALAADMASHRGGGSVRTEGDHDEILVIEGDCTLNVLRDFARQESDNLASFGFTEVKCTSGAALDGPFDNGGQAVGGDPWQ